MGKKIMIPCPNCKSRITIEPDNNDSVSPANGKNRMPIQNRLLAKNRTASMKNKPLNGIALRNKILKSIRDLPPMPQVISKAQEVMANPTSGIKELTQVIETDQAIASRMVKLANSAYYGLSGKVATVQKATTMLGQQTLREVLMTAGYAKLLDKTLNGYGYASGDLWRHAMAVGVGSRIIADMKQVEDTDEAYLAGLIHDSGKLVLDPYIVKRRSAFDRFLEDESRTFLDAEKHLFGFDHADIASDICLKWKVPGTVTSAVRYHHCPTKSGDTALAYVIHLADQIARSGGLGYGDDDYIYQVEEGVINFLELSQSDIQKISAKVIESMLKFQD